jgi:hypothetical protein
MHIERWAFDIELLFLAQHHSSLFSSSVCSLVVFVVVIFAYVNDRYTDRGGASQLAGD